MLGVTDIGFLLVQYMTYKSQSLFQVAKMLNELGGAPKQVGLDGAGELKGDTGQHFSTITVYKSMIRCLDIVTNKEKLSDRMIQ